VATYRIKIDLDNAAFDDGSEGAEVARILRNLADKCSAHGCAQTYSNLRDVNGNTVGAAKRTGKAPRH
jgi:hypothetical protein